MQLFAPEKRSLWPYLILAILLYFGFFYGMTSYAIHDNNEGLYAEIAKEMLLFHHYSVPHLNKVPYIEKPPMLYWLIALSYKIFGVSVFAARLIPSLMSCVVIFSVLCFCRAIGRPLTGYFASIILCTSLGFMFIGRIIFFDMTLTAFFTGSLLLFFLWYQRLKDGYLILAFILLAGAFLTKGIMAPGYAFLIAVGLISIKRTWPIHGRGLFNPLGIGLFLIITGTWVIFACVSDPGFAWGFFVNENLYRLLNLRTPKDYYNGPIYYYVPRLFAYLFPWLFLCPVWLKPFTLRETEPLKIFLWLWFIVPMLVFSLGGDKGNYYMVIACPALSILLGMEIERWYRQNTFKPMTALYIALGVLLSVAIIGANFRADLPEGLKPITLLISFWLPTQFIVGLILALRYKKLLLSFLLIASLYIPLSVMIIAIIADKQNQDSQKILTDYALAHAPSRTSYLYRDYEEISSVLFYFKPMPIIYSQSRDLYYGSHTPEAVGQFINQNQFRAEAKQQRVYVFMRDGQLHTFLFHYAALGFCVAASAPRAYLLTNDPTECEARPLATST